MKRFNIRKLSLRFKLLGYFLAFGAIILIVLWVFQSFFLKPLYVFSKSIKVEKGAESISRSVKYNKNVWATVDNVAQVFYDRGIPNAYGLDGGQTSEILFRGEPYNHVDYGAERVVSDILYFASALPEAEVGA